jgi:hypothetical protein
MEEFVDVVMKVWRADGGSPTSDFFRLAGRAGIRNQGIR